MQFRDALMVSLGHNSSAIYTNGTANIGYEQERLDRIKSSSRPPLKALFQIEKHCGVPNGTPVFVTHWFDHFGDALPECKYSNIAGYVSSKNSKIVSHSVGFTHHDAHAWSAFSFYKYHLKSSRSSAKPMDGHVIVADGFGNFQEVVSIYSFSPRGVELVDRIYGYESSLGLMYQYATDFVGMKMNQDEYKFLGYENKIKGVLSEGQISKLDKLVGDEVTDFATRMIGDSQNFRGNSTGEIINMPDLMGAKEYWRAVFEGVLSVVFNGKQVDPTSYEARVTIGAFIQETIQDVLGYIVNQYKIVNLCVAGGIFYNVKLNNYLLKKIPGLFSAVPLAGDQGAAIGFYEKHFGDFNWSTLSIGERGFYGEPDFLDLADKDKRIFMPQTRDECIDLLTTKIMAGEICNLVSNKMEYGPRALGSTSSLFLPTQRNSNINNSLNSRNEVMPFAPLILEHNLCNVFDESQYSRVVGSDQFMVVTYDYLHEPTEENKGVYHIYPREYKFSGRPQVITSASVDPLYQVMFDLFVNHSQLLVTNTSFNYHGEPIVFSTQDIIATHNKQMANAEKLDAKVNLILYRDKN